MNLQELWKQYRAALTEIQVIGANVQDEDQAAQQVGNLCREAEQWCELRIRALESGRN